MFIVFFDLETAGLLDHQPDIQLAAVATQDFEPVATFERKIRFDARKADPQALELNSYQDLAWADSAIEESDVVRDFAGFIQPYRDLQMVSKRTGRPYSVARLAGHNAATFDSPRLLRMFQRHGEFLAADSYRTLDTLQLALWDAARRGDSHQSYRLSECCQRAGIDAEGAHDALSDVLMCAKLAQHLIESI